MKFSNKAVVAAGFLACLLIPGSALPSAAAAAYAAFPQSSERYADIRELVNRTQSDLHRASNLEHYKGDQKSRYENAQRHLSTFDRHLTKGNFDKSELDDAISNLKNILDKNTLQAESRDALQRDIEDLRLAREHR